MDIDLTKYTEEELLELNRRVVERIRLLRLGRCRANMAELHVGDRVSFHPECGHEVTGTIVRLNRKSVTVVSTDGAHWRVGPGFLTKIADPSDRHDDAEAADADLITKVQGDLLALAARQRDRGKA
jgi:hypothetical protein